MGIRKNVVKMGESVISPEFVYTRNGLTTFECREMISREANGSEQICVFKCVFAPREAHDKHKHTQCDEIIFCISGRGVEGIETSPGVFVEHEYVPGTALHLPKGVGHYTRNPDYFENLHLVGIFVGVHDMRKETTGYVSLGEITPAEMTVA
ncbi:MAG TPA: cupin domain-containing protein [Bauldia sp.]|nr:cupin domain-containing protein [Bauldia sp.]